MTPRQMIDEWYDGRDPMLGAVIVARQSGGDITPSDALRSGLLPLGWDTGAAHGHGGLLTNSVRLSDRMPERIAKARADIERWNFELDVRARCAARTVEHIKAAAEKVREWQTQIWQLLTRS